MSQSTQTPQWGPPPTEPSPAVQRNRRWGRNLAIGILAAIVGLIMLAVVLSPFSSDSNNSSQVATSAAPQAVQPAITEPPATVSAYNPTASDITVKLKIVGKDNFGSAGSVITYEPDVTLDPSAFDPDVTYQVTYEVRGGQDGPEIHSFTISGDHYTYDQEVTQTASVNQRLTARVLSVDATS